MTSPYEILGIARDAEDDTIKAAYRRLAMRYHPDRNADPAVKAGAEAMFKDVQAAYELLSDPDKRRRYDETGETVAATPIEAEAEGLLMTLFKQALAADDGRSPIDLARGMLSNIQDQCLNEKQQATKTVARLTRRSGKFKTKGERNLLQMLIDQQLGDLDTTIRRLEHNLDVVRAARLHADLYESLEEPRLPQDARPDAVFVFGGAPGTAW